MDDSLLSQVESKNSIGQPFGLSIDVVQFCQLEIRMSSTTTTKPFEITKRMVWEAYKRVCAKGGAAGIDGLTIEGFNKDAGFWIHEIDPLPKCWHKPCLSTGIAE